MSAYLTIHLPMTDRQSLVEALVTMGIKPDHIEVAKEVQRLPLVGYQGDVRPQRADVVVRRAAIGAGSNDIGFEATETGFKLQISQHDSNLLGARWQSELAEVYRRVHQRRLDEMAENERRAEAERRALEQKKLVEAQRSLIVEKAKKLGYRVEQSNAGESLRLVLCKRVY